MKAKMKTLMAAIALGSTLGYTASASANVVDLFDEPASPLFQQVTDNTNGGAVADQFGVGANILGGYRDLIVDVVSGGTSTRGAKLTVADGSLAWSNDTGVRSKAAVQWDGDDVATPGSLNINATGGGLNGANLVFQQGCGTLGCNTFVALLNFADNGFNYSIDVYTDATHWSKLSSGTLFGIDNPPPLGGALAPYSSNYSFAWFGLAAGNYVLDGLPLTITQGSAGAADFTNVGAIEFTLDSSSASCYQTPGLSCSAAIDLEIDSITKVPEPASLSLVGLALVGLAGLRRRKQPV